MNALLKRYAERIDAASLRERVAIFLALTLVLAYVAYATLLQPLRAAQRRSATETAQQQKELQTTQAEVQRLALSAQVDPDAGTRARRATILEQLAEADSRIGKEQRRFTPPERMRGMLQDMLQRNRSVAIVDLRSLPVTPIGAEKPGNPGELYRHGLELTLSGSYVELYEYLRALERLPTQLYWRRLELAVTDHPLMTLKLTVYTVSFDRAWLIV